MKAITNIHDPHVTNVLLLRSFSFCRSEELVIRTDNDGKACVHDLLVRRERLKLLKKTPYPGNSAPS